MYRAVTHNIQVTAAPAYAAERSAPDQGRYFWTYEIEIVNLSEQIVQLLARRWIITDAHGKCDRVSGPGVVGQQPLLRPGEVFRYTSGCALATTSGIMQGAYLMIDAGGREFEIEIPAFSLDSPFVRTVLN